ncbi:hypothetical protein ACFLZG_02065 [Thermodesulfobacteriota bacterium]
MNILNVKESFAECGWYNQTMTSYCIAGILHYFIIESVHETSQEAYDAAVIFTQTNPWTPENGISVNGPPCGENFDGQTYSSWVVTQNQSQSGNGEYTWRFFLWIHTPCVDDGDGDGIPDEQDPYTDTEPFKWIPKKEVRNTSDKLLYCEIYTDKGDKFTYGNPNAESDMYNGLYDGSIIENQVPSNDYEWNNFENVYQEDYLLTYLTDIETGIAIVLNDQPISNSIQIADGSTGQVEGLTEGTDNTGNTIETEYLEDVVINTKAIADNQKKYGVCD